MQRLGETELKKLHWKEEEHRQNHPPESPLLVAKIVNTSPELGGSQQELQRRLTVSSGGRLEDILLLRDKEINQSTCRTPRGDGSEARKVVRGEIPVPQRHAFKDKPKKHKADRVILN